MPNNKTNDRELVVSPKKCPTKHARAYKTSFGQKFCPDCGHNVEGKMR